MPGSSITKETRKSPRLLKQQDAAEAEKPAKKLKVEYKNPTPKSTKAATTTTKAKTTKEKAKPKTKESTQPTTQNSEQKDAPRRCFWVSSDPIYLAYHDKEWGVPEKDNRKLFEMICLEGQQAGLSWITVLKKRDAYRESFHNFDPAMVAAMTTQDVNELVQNPGIIRHKGKIEAIINNAKAYMEMQKKGEDFSAFVWNFVQNKPIVQTTDSFANTTTEVSDAMSKALIKKGFKYVGSTICYSFMQACGLVNDHHTKCNFRNCK